MSDNGSINMETKLQKRILLSLAENNENDIENENENDLENLNQNDNQNENENYIENDIENFKGNEEDLLFKKTEYDEEVIDHKDNIDEEINNVNMLCGQIEDYVKNSNHGKNNVKKVVSVNKGLKDSIKSSKIKKTRNINEKINSINISNTNKVVSGMAYHSPIGKSPANPAFHSKTNSNHKAKFMDNYNTFGGDVFNRLYNQKTVRNSDEKTTIRNSDEKSKPEEHIKKKVNIDEMINRFRESEMIKVNKLEGLKKKVMEEELKEKKSVPETNNPEIKLSEDFLTRVKNYKETIENKKKDAIKKREKQIEEEENKIIQEIKNKYSKKVNSDKKVNLMYEWEKNRINKISKIKETQNNLTVSQCSFRPKININSRIIAEAKSFANGEETVERLYKNDVKKREHKKQILQDIYAPSFNPMINTYKNRHVTSSSVVTEGNRSINLKTEYFSNRDQW